MSTPPIHDPIVKPCPFCGELAKVSDTKVHHWILCDNVECELAATAMLPTASEALSKWNTRSNDAEQDRDKLAIQKHVLTELGAHLSNQVTAMTKERDSLASQLTELRAIAEALQDHVLVSVDSDNAMAAFTEWKERNPLP